MNEPPGYRRGKCCRACRYSYYPENHDATSDLCSKHGYKEVGDYKTCDDHEFGEDVAYRTGFPDITKQTAPRYRSATICGTCVNIGFHKMIYYCRAYPKFKSISFGWVCDDHEVK